MAGIFGSWGNKGEKAAEDTPKAEAQSPAAAPAPVKPEHAERPKLTLRKLSESQPIVKNTTEVRTIIPIDQYSVVQTSDRIVVIDERGTEIQDFTPNSNTKIHISWDEMAKKQNCPTLLSRSRYDNSIKIPPSLAAEKERLIALNDGKVVRVSGSPSEVSPGGMLKTVNSGTHLLLSSDGETYLGFKTMHEGTRLPPRQWSRLEGTYKDDVPSELRDEMRLLRFGLEHSTHWLTLNANKMQIGIDTEGLNIVKPREAGTPH